MTKRRIAIKRAGLSDAAFAFFQKRIQFAGAKLAKVFLGDKAPDRSGYNVFWAIVLPVTDLLFDQSLSTTA